MDSTPTADGLVRTILADPADPLPRLVFADWLDETDSVSNHAWAKYLRLAVDLVHTPMTPVRRAYIETEQQRAAADVRAGLVVRAEQFLAHEGPFRQLLPLRCLSLNLDSVEIAPATVARLAPDLAREFSALPIVDSVTLVVAVDAAAIDVAGEQLALRLGRRVEAVRAAADTLLAAIERHYTPEAEFAACVLPLAHARLAEVSPLQREAESGPVARVVSMMLLDALTQGAEELTAERHGPRVEVRFLFSGERKLWGGLPERLHLPVVARMQMLAGLNLGASEADQIGSLPHIHRGRLVNLPLRVRPSRSGPRVTLTMPRPGANPAA